MTGGPVCYGPNVTGAATLLASTDVIGAGRAAEADRLSLSRGQPVAEHTRTAYRAQGKAVRVMVSVIPRDTLILRYIVPA